MNDTTKMKLNELHKIYDNYEIYKGPIKSKLEKELLNIKNKISEEEFNNLMLAYNSYKNYLISIFAETNKVFVKIEKENSFKDIDKLLEPLDEL